jgi:hypothetical protein
MGLDIDADNLLASQFGAYLPRDLRISNVLKAH